MKIKLSIFLMSLTCTLSFSTLSRAQEEGLDYDSIVNELSKSKTEVPKVDPYNDDPLSMVEIHLGAAMASTTFGVVNPDATSTQVAQRGFQVGLGIDLFSPYWMAEGTMQNYFEREYEKSQIGLQAFDLKLFYKNRFDTSIGFRVGGGLAARYLSVKTKELGEQKYTTPSTVAAAGVDLFIGETFSVGGEISARNSLTSETPDQSSVDLLLRLDAHL